MSSDFLRKSGNVEQRHAELLSKKNQRLRVFVRDQDELEVVFELLNEFIGRDELLAALEVAKLFYLAVEPEEGVGGVVT